MTIVRDLPDTHFLDLFRAIAGSWVMLAHCAIWSGGSVPAMLSPKLAVDLFMVLSGFLMMKTLDESRKGDGWVRSFYLRRFFRIAPVYYLALVVTVALWPAISSGMAGLQSLDPKWAALPQYQPQTQDLSPLSLLMHATFLFGLSPTLSFSTGLPDWSLSLEMQFYALFPLLFVLVRRWWWLAVPILGCAMASNHLYSSAVERGAITAFEEPSFLPFKLGIFLVGMLFYVAGKHRQRLPMFAAIGMLALAYRTSFDSAPVVLLMIGSVAAFWWFGEPLGLKPFLKSKPVSFLSDASYSVYLFHGFALFLAGWPALRFATAMGASPMVARLTLTLVVVVVTYVIGWLLYRYFEHPTNEWGKGIARKSVSLPRSAPPAHRPR